MVTKKEPRKFDRITAIASNDQDSSSKFSSQEEKQKTQMEQQRQRVIEVVSANSPVIVANQNATDTPPGMAQLGVGEAKSKKTSSIAAVGGCEEKSQLLPPLLQQQQGGHHNNQQYDMHPQIQMQMQPFQNGFFPQSPNNAEQHDLENIVSEQVERHFRNYLDMKNAKTKEQKGEESQDAATQAETQQRDQTLQHQGHIINCLEQELNNLRRHSQMQEREIIRLRNTTTGLTQDIRVIIQEERRMASLAVENIKKETQKEMARLAREHKREVEDLRKQLAESERQRKQETSTSTASNLKHRPTDTDEVDDKRKIRAQTLLQRTIHELESLDLSSPIKTDQPRLLKSPIKRPALIDSMPNLPTLTTFF